MKNKTQPSEKLSESTAQVPAKIEETSPPSETEQTVLPSASEKRDGALWKACSWLSSKGKEVAKPGETIFLSKSLSDFYLRTAPGSIEPADDIQ